MKIKVLDENFVICKVKNFFDVSLDKEYIFTAKTKEENSILCKEEDIPPNTINIEKGWKGLVIEGELDFSLVGIIAEISNILAKIKVSVFVISTFNTDYIFIKEESLNKTILELEDNGYEISKK
ncbi:ACT domain-containing protein [Miniphocaeibacter massiliensis]|uniref:ACT domain-containing protein n=1 Tax=Miniphocaeibacter massiliensis TaxID=2041841 RepID=UPI000C1BEB7F|nr:ACT domain-containing protein [Miniphocaeibacter massiliensis]